MWMASKGHLQREGKSARRSLRRSPSSTHFLGQIPHPIQSSSEMKAIFFVGSTSIHSFPTNSKQSGWPAPSSPEQTRRTHPHDRAALLALLSTLLGLASIGVDQSDTVRQIKVSFCDFSSHPPPSFPQGLQEMAPLRRNRSLPGKLVTHFEVCSELQTKDAMSASVAGEGWLYPFVRRSSSARPLVFLLSPRPPHKTKIPFEPVRLVLPALLQLRVPPPSRTIG